MAIFIALLRGINVSGKNVIKMDTLRKCFAQLGFISIRYGCGRDFLRWIGRR